MLWQDTDQSIATAADRSGRDLPSTFGENFEASWNEGRLFTQSLAGDNARMAALQDHIDNVKATTGKDLASQIDWASLAQADTITADMLRDQVNAAADKMDVPQVSADDIEKAAVEKSRAAGTAYAAMAAREKGPGGGLGEFLGGAASAATDPINLAALPLAPETGGVGILAAALRWGAVAGVAQAGIEAAGAPFHEEVQPGYLDSGAPLMNIASAAGQGALMGGAFKALGNTWTRVKTGAWPQSVRDAGNVVESEANIASTNVYPGAAGEVAHREALAKSIDSILQGRPVDVADRVPPEMDAQAGQPTVTPPAAPTPGLNPAEAQTVAAAVEQAAKRPILETSMPSGANSTKDLNGPVYVDPRVPQPLRGPVAVHETVEQTLMSQGMPYERAHVIATAAERQVVEAAGMNWEHYTHQWDGLLATIEHEKPGAVPPDLHVDPEAAIGHHAHKAGRAVPVEAIRASAAEASTAAEAARAPTGESQPGLPFEATAAEAHAQASNEALASGVAQIAKRAGYDMPADEAATIAARLIKATPEELADTLRDLQMSPRQVAEAPVRAAEPAKAAPLNVEPPEKVVGTPDHDAAMRADIDRERMTGDRQIPVGVDAEGNAIMRSLDGAMDEIDALKNAADQDSGLRRAGCGANRGGRLMDVQDCIAKLVATSQITKALGDEALEMFRRSKAEYSRELGPASADAAAALEAAKKLRDRAAKNQLAIAADVKTFRVNEQRIKEDPRGRNAALAGILTKDTLRGDNRLTALRKDQPDHPIFSGGNADYRYQVARDRMYSMLGEAMEKLRPGFLRSADVVRSTKNFIYERFGVSTGDVAAKTVSDAFGKVIEYGANRATQAGKIFEPREDWRVPQPWNSSRVARFPEAQFVADFREAMDGGGLKLWNKETNAPAGAGDTDLILKRAYSDIKTQGGSSVPFSKDMRTFEFQPGQAGADAWLKLQGKYGVGNEIMSTVDQHLDHMARTISLHETFGAHPDAQFAALLRMVKDDPSKLKPGLGWLDSENTLKNTYKIIAGKGHPVASETVARVMSGVRDLVGLASLRNLLITIVPGDTAMTFMASNFHGMSGFNVLSHVFDGTMTKDVARHLQIASHSYMDYMQNAVRRYEDQINFSGLVRKVSRAVVKATGADLWTENGRLGWQVSMLNQIAGFRDLPFDRLDPAFREHFLEAYGFTPADWDKIRAADTFDAGNGARYLDPDKLPDGLGERVLQAVKEQGSYAFHQPDARTQAIIGGGAVRGSLSGEMWLAAGQYKQFALERMTTHLMRILVDGPIENRVMRGLAFTALSMAAGAVSIQAANVVAGKNPMDMADPKFWIRAFARGGAGGVYGDILGAAFEGDRGGLDLAAQMAGPVPGLIGDVLKTGTAPLRRELFDQQGQRATSGTATEAFGVARRWTPSTFYTKLAVDRLFWDKLQVLLDPNYRQSFRRTEQNARRNGGQGFWWDPGTPAPQGPPTFH